MIPNKGRQVYLHPGDCVAHWHEDSDRLFARVQARGALFDESAVHASGGGNGWLIFGCYVLGCLICGAGCAYLAV